MVIVWGFIFILLEGHRVIARGGEGQRGAAAKKPAGGSEFSTLMHDVSTAPRAGLDALQAAYVCVCARAHGRFVLRANRALFVM